jgi:hypothetical protein
MTRSMQNRDDIPADNRVSFNYRSTVGMDTDPWRSLHQLGNGPGRRQIWQTSGVRIALVTATPLPGTLPSVGIATE